MSRSYKKNPVLTDGHCRTTKETKQIANRCVRHHNKRITSGYLMRESRYRDILTLDGVSYKRFFCSYNIHDYISRWTKEEALKDFKRYIYLQKYYKNENEFLNKHWKKYQYRK